MYNVYVPINNLTFANDDKGRVVDMLNKMGVSRVFLCVGSYHFDKEQRDIELSVLKDNTAFLHARGFEVGSWMWSFMDTRSDSPYTRMKTVGGEESSFAVCPNDKEFRSFAAEYLCSVAECGVDIVLYDDDYEFGQVSSKLCCLCDNHLASISEMLGGEDLTVDMLRPYLVSGKPNKYRSAWQRAKRESLLGFAREMRSALDKVAPQVRIGLCSCFPVWGIDGASALEVARELAGNTKPLLRLSGGPYWAIKRSIGGHRLQDTIETSRMELSFCRDADDVEIISEGDTYPRPRWQCPASFLEGFETAMIADGGTDGILKYTMDYHSSSRYETGYCKRHIENMPMYAKLKKLFGDKKAVGVRVFEHMSKFENAELCGRQKTEKELGYFVFSYASRMLAAASVPIIYDDSSSSLAVFGENARYISKSELKKGVILDARAAEILTERGIDVGLISSDGQVPVLSEVFTKQDETVCVSGEAYKLFVNDKADIESYFVSAEGKSATFCLWANDVSRDDRLIPASYRYENANGERFLVFAFEGYLANDTLIRNYARADQIKNALSYLNENTPPIVTTSPDLYVLAKREGNRCAIGLWNFCADPIDEPTVKLNEDIKIVDSIGGDASFEDGMLYLSRIEPYGFAAVEWEIKDSI